MGNKQSSHVVDILEDSGSGSKFIDKNKVNNNLMVERLIDPTEDLKIGLASDNVSNTFKNQAIRVGFDDIRRLEEFIESEKQIKYEFEKNTKLIFRKNNINDEVVMIFEDDNKKIEKVVSPVIKRFYKPIGIPNGSEELDKIERFIKNTN